MRSFNEEVVGDELVEEHGVRRFSQLAASIKAARFSEIILLSLERHLSKKGMMLNLEAALNRRR